jgi:DNA-binding response OmpR family regulator
VSTVLIVEDDRATTGLLKTVFEMEGFETLVCPRPERVIETVREARPDLIMMDFHLAETNSLSVLRELKTDLELKYIPVLMTSGLDRSQECKEAGAEAFLIKPFRPVNLMVAVRQVLDASA